LRNRQRKKSRIRESKINEREEEKGEIKEKRKYVEIVIKGNKE
jgi:hypothetical protein